MGTIYLSIIIAWCGDPGAYGANRAVVERCRREAIACVRQLKDFETDDVVNKCLLKQERTK
jgi:hypothetical protein